MITATVVADDGAPYVRITATAHPVEAVTVDDKGEEVTYTVRGSYADMVGLDTARDYEAPQCRPLYYRNADGEVSADAELPSSGIWLVPCQEPELAVPVFIPKDDGVSAWSYSETRDQLDIPGGNPFITTVRSRARSTTLRMATLWGHEVAPMEDCLQVDGQHYLSVDPGVFWPYRGVSFVDISGISASPSGDTPEPLWFWEATLTEVDRPTVSLTRPTGWYAMPLTWAEMPTTWAAMP